MAIKNLQKSKYLKYIKDKVGWNNNNSGPTYSSLFEYLIDVPYDYDVPMDENRALDGLHLRYEYQYDKKISDSDLEKARLIPRASVLEVLVAFSSRIFNELWGSYEDENGEGKVFWRLISNLKLDVFDDVEFNPVLIGDILEDWMTKNYSSDGHGSPFPLSKPSKYDMRIIEMWSQVNIYISQNKQNLW